MLNRAIAAVLRRAFSPAESASRARIVLGLASFPVLETLEERINFGANAPTYGPDTPVSSCSTPCQCDGPGAPETSQDTGGSDPDASTDPVIYFNGMPVIKGSDLSSSGTGLSWGQTRSWTGAYENAVNGNGWSVTQLPSLLVTGGLEGNGTAGYAPSGTEADERIEATFGGETFTYKIDTTGSFTSYANEGTDTSALTWNGTDTLTLTDSQGNQYAFYDVSRNDGSNSNYATNQPMVAATDGTLYGKLKSYTSADGVTTLSTSYDGNNNLSSVTISESGTDVVRYLYTYANVTNDLVDAASATPPVMLQSVAYQQKVGGSWSGVRRVDYTYYTGRVPDGSGGWNNDSNGRLGDLEFASTSDPSKALSVTGITLSGQTATATTSSAHGYHIGDVVIMAGADQPEYDGTVVITSVPSSTTFSYAVDGSPVSTATGTMSVSTPIDTSYYRYYSSLAEQPLIGAEGAMNDPNTTGGPTYLDSTGSPFGDVVVSLLKTVVQGASFSRLAASDPSFQSDSDTSIQPYINNFFTYERWGDHEGVDGWDNITAIGGNRDYDWRNGYRSGTEYRVTSEIAQGAGCTCTGNNGQGYSTYQYAANYDESTDPVSGLPYFGYAQIDYNVWRMKTTEGLPDGNENVVYSDEMGLPMLNLQVQLDSANARTVSDTSVDWGSTGDPVTVTATSTGHGFSTGDYVQINGVNPELFNGIFQVTRIDADTFSFQVPFNYFGAHNSYQPSSLEGTTITATKVLSQLATFHKYDSQGHEIMTAMPSAVTGYDDSTIDLLAYSGSSYTYLSSSSGLIKLFDFYTSTSSGINATTAGGVLGYLQDTKVAQGQSGISSATITEQKDYFAQTDGTNTVYPVADDTLYGSTGGSNARTTRYSYTWDSSHPLHMKSMTVTQPPVTSSQNGPASSTSDTTNADKTTSYYDSDGRVVFTKDGDGYVNYTQYDAATGAVVKTIQDADTSVSTDFTISPSTYSLSSPSGTRLRLITTYTVDGLGRTKSMTDPNGNVTYTTYNDTNHETRTYPGWHSVGGGQYNTTGPVIISREYRPTYNGGSGNDVVYEESLTATIANTSSSTPTGNESLASIQTLSRDYENSGSQVIRSDRYFSLSGTSYTTNAYFGTVGTNFYSSTYGFDHMGRRNKAVDAVGTITRTVYDAFGRVASIWVGTNDTPTSGYWSPTNAAGMTQTRIYYYDNYTNSTTAVGDGNLTRMIEIPSSFNPQRVTDYFYDWRDRLVTMKQGVKLNSSTHAEDTSGEDTATHRLITYYTLDNLGEITQTDLYAADQVGISYSGGVPSAPSSTKLRARTTASYDDQGRIYQSSVVSVDGSGTVGSSLTTKTWYDHRGNVIKTSAPGGTVGKEVYDGAGRLIKQYSSDGGGDSSWSDASNVTGDQVLSATANTYDSAGNLIATTARQRFNTDTSSDTGELGNPTTGPKARVSYQVFYYDAANRQTDAVDVGTNGGSAYTRPGSVPSSSDTVHVTHTAYNSAGWVDSTTDPRGIVTKYGYDLAGRQTSVINAYNASINSGNPSGSNNQTTTYTYDGIDHVLTQTAVMPTGTNSQTTAYIYGVTPYNGSYFYSNDLLAKIEYPSKSTGSASTSASDDQSYGCNDLGQTILFTDQNGTQHSYAYDSLGRQDFDAQSNDSAVIASGNPQNVDTAVLQIATYFDDSGRPYLYTSYNGSSTVVNQVEQLYNGFGQVVQEYQEHSGMVAGGSSASVQYSYDQSSNDSRLSAITYVNGRILHYGYNSGLDSSISRVSYLADDNGSGGVGTHLEDYSYLGDDTIVNEAHSQTGVSLSYIQQSGDTLASSVGGDQYTGFDQFGRVIDQNYTTGTSSTDRFQYGYDRDDDVLYKNNRLSSANSELYHANSSTSGDNNTAYDPLSRLTAFARGTLSASSNNSGGLDTISSSSRTQGWTLDQLGNWTASSTNGTSTSRTTNSQNEVTAVGSSSLTFDNNGNTTQDETGKKYVYDAWNRLVAVKNSSGTTLETYSYDALGRRIKENPGTATDLYYGGTDDWQVLEEKQGSTTTKQNVWSLSYIDDLVLRDDNSTSGSLGKSGSGLGRRLYVQHDANHNVTALLNTSGTVQERFVYDPYGASTVLNSSWSSTTDSYSWQYRFQGGRQDTTSGLINFRNRDLSTTLGRWVQRDPLGLLAGLNVYASYSEDPVMRLDPFGMRDDFERDLNNQQQEDYWRYLQMRKAAAWACRPWEQEPCDKLWDDIGRKTKLLEDEIDKFDPVSDAIGGQTYRLPTGQIGITKPDGHRNEIDNLKRGIKNDMEEYDNHCGGRPPKRDRDYVWKQVNRTIPDTPPVFEPPSTWKVIGLGLVIGAYEGIKWGIAIGLAPETGGTSLVGAGALP